MANELPADSWFTEEELAKQRARNIHARFFMELAVDDPHRENDGWWCEVGIRLYRAWANETHRCDECDDLAFVNEQMKRLSTTEEGEI